MVLPLFAGLTFHAGAGELGVLRAVGRLFHLDGGPWELSDLASDNPAEVHELNRQIGAASVIPSKDKTAPTGSSNGTSTYAKPKAATCPEQPLSLRI